MINTISSNNINLQSPMKLQFESSQINDFNIQNPKIAISGINPHAGEKGTIGNEEINFKSEIKMGRKNTIILSRSGDLINKMYLKKMILILMIPLKEIHIAKGLNISFLISPQ